ncbi:hypothetical protein HJG60_008095 [Phyllostomus discolor]|uniref:Uncharacterized protein n=1 Tax=Phyllostomus discolor TaxID=89673 RepID=A0A834BI40_9CHIR|nr:hypothetical protein HJG60_008095 [Phyllostomus discolor]
MSRLPTAEHKPAAPGMVPRGQPVLRQTRAPGDRRWDSPPCSARPAVRPDRRALGLPLGVGQAVVPGARCLRRALSGFRKPEGGPPRLSPVSCAAVSQWVPDVPAYESALPRFLPALRHAHVPLRIRLLASPAWPGRGNLST